jgi:hypothetical protein
VIEIPVRKDDTKQTSARRSVRVVVSEGAISVGDQTIKKWASSWRKVESSGTPPNKSVAYSLAYLSDVDSVQTPPLFMYQLGSFDESNGALNFQAVLVVATEPGAAALLSAGLLLLAGFRRFRSAREASPQSNRPPDSVVRFRRRRMTL